VVWSTQSNLMKCSVLATDSTRIVIIHTQHIPCTWAIQFCPSGRQYLVGVWPQNSSSLFSFPLRHVAMENSKVVRLFDFVFFWMILESKESQNIENSQRTCENFSWERIGKELMILSFLCLRISLNINVKCWESPDTRSLLSRC
jgi:hypothetical protein